MTTKYISKRESQGHIHNKNNRFNITDDLVLHELTSDNEVKKLEQQMVFVEGKQIDINFQDEEFGWRTPLHIACEKGFLKCCKILLQNGANPLMRMTQGWTAAHCAAEAGSLEILKMLSQYSGVLISRDDAGITPRQIAQTYGHDGCVEFLEIIESHPSQRTDILRDRMQNAARRSLICLYKDNVDSLYAV